MIGGYARTRTASTTTSSRGGSNRDEFVVVRQNEERRLALMARQRHCSGKKCEMKDPFPSRAWVPEPGQVHWLPTGSSACKNVWTSREGMDTPGLTNVETKPGIGYPEVENRTSWKGGWLRDPSGKSARASVGSFGCWQTFSPTRTCGNWTTIRAVRFRLTSICTPWATANTALHAA